MHHCLEVLEILNHIIEYLGFRDLTSLARVNRALSEPTLDVIWKYPFDISVLLYCFPKDLWYEKESEYDSGSVLYFNRPLIKSDWCRVALYTSRIRTLTFGRRSRCTYNPDLTDVDLNVYHAIDRAIAEGMHPFPLLPRLQSIVFDEGRTPSWQLLLFLSTATNSLEINMEHANKMDDSQLGIQSVLASLRKRCPAIRDFTFTCDAPNSRKDILSHFTKDLHEMQDLKSICISQYPISFWTIQEISLAPKLQELTFDIGRLALNHIPPEIHFPCLVKCTVYGGAKNMAFQFIKSLKSPSFAELHTILDTSFSSHDIHEILTILLHFEFTIKAITTTWLLDPEEDISLTNVEDHITANTLAPLLHFSRIQKFRLNIYASFQDIDDIFIQKLSMSCPQLTHFDLGSRGVISLPTRVTLAGLVALAEHCQCLEKVGLFFDCSDAQWWHQKNIQSNPKTTHLSVGCSAIDIHNIDTIAKFLSKIFPALKYIHHQSNVDVDEDEDEDNERWYSVLQKVKQYNNI